VTVNAFGYEVLTLDEVISQLTNLREESPELGTSPVWVMNCPPLYWPVKEVRAKRKSSGGSMVELHVERG